MRIAVIGCGHTGLVTAACLAGMGQQVICADPDDSKIRRFNAGQLPLFEPHLESLVQRGKDQGRLEFTTEIAQSIGGADVIFICGGVPLSESGDADLSGMDRLARTIAAAPGSSKLIVVRSPVPVHTGQQLKKLLGIYDHTRNREFRVASSPSFVREGSALSDFVHPDYIVIGVEDREAEETLREIYGPILDRKPPCLIHGNSCPSATVPKLIVTSLNSAELIKHAANSFLALKISYANMIADLCEEVGADIEQVTDAMGLDPRIGGQALRAGLGFGGARLTRHLRALIRVAECAGLDFALLREAESINRRRVERFLEKTRQALWVLQGKQVGVLGLAYKPDTDDIRNAPSLEIIRRLLAEGAIARVHDPRAMEKVRVIFPSVVCTDTPYDLARAAEALLVITEWEQYRGLDWKRIRELMARPLIMDGRNLLDPGDMQALGFEYHCVGRQHGRGLF